MQYTRGYLATTYRGIRFRSRLEARWAMFFDILGIDFHYEPGSFPVVPGGYTPDFLIPKQATFDRRLWVEVKPSDYEPHDVDKPDALADEETPVAFIHKILLPECGFDAARHSIYYGGSCDYDHGFCRCSRCGMIGFEFEGRSSRLRCGCWDGDRDDEWTSDCVELVGAYRKAIEYKFEEANRVGGRF